METLRRRAAIVMVACAAIAIPTTAVTAATAVKPYAVSIASGVGVAPLLSVADRVPLTGNPGLEYQMVGIPDGLGSYKEPGGDVVLFMNHELGRTVQSQPVVGGPINVGAIVSRYVLDGSANVRSGARAYDSVFAENTLVGPAAQTDNTTAGFARFCSGSLAWTEAGFDRPIYLAGEESTGSDSFDGRGGQTVAIFDGELHTLPKMGRFSKENTLIMPQPGGRTVAMVLEDGPSSPDSQLYMYVGWKDGSPGATALARNGLDNGKLYVFASLNKNKNDELAFQNGAIGGRWIEMPGAESMTDAELETASDAAGAMGFVRIEDGAFSKTRPSSFFFDTTGGNKAAGNELGRLYNLSLNPSDPTLPAELKVVYNADEIIASGGDIAISPDNLDVSANALVINEDGTTQSRAVMASKGRDGSIWSIPLVEGARISAAGLAAAIRIVELDPPGRDGVAVGPGVWETSGIIDASALFGPGAWLTDVQAHPPTAAPAAFTVEDGQLLLIRP